MTLAHWSLQAFQSWGSHKKAVHPDSVRNLPINPIHISLWQSFRPSFRRRDRPIHQMPLDSDFESKHYSHNKDQESYIDMEVDLEVELEVEMEVASTLGKQQRQDVHSQARKQRRTSECATAHADGEDNEEDDEEEEDAMAKLHRFYLEFQAAGVLHDAA